MIVDDRESLIMADPKQNLEFPSSPPVFGGDFPFHTTDCVSVSIPVDNSPVNWI